MASLRGSWLDRLLNWVFRCRPEDVQRRMRNRGWYDG